MFVLGKSSSFFFHSPKGSDDDDESFPFINKIFATLSNLKKVDRNRTEQYEKSLSPSPSINWSLDYTKNEDQAPTMCV